MNGSTILDVEGFPIERSWFIVFPRGKQLSVVARAFFEYLKTEGEQLLEGALGGDARAGVGANEARDATSPSLAPRI